MVKLDLLAFGAHPDDVELSCSGLLLVEKSRGKKTGVVDLTEGELGTRGNRDTREQEAAEAAKVLQLDVRENLKLPDGFFQNDREAQLKVIVMIRKYRPEVVLCNAPEDRHPDHGRAAQLVSDASFLAGLSRIETFDGIQPQEPWRPKYVLHYIQDRPLDPDFLIDITPVFDLKMNSIRAYKTQFHHPGVEGPETYISSPQFLESLSATNRLLGKRIGVAYAEGYISRKMIGLKNLDTLILQST